MGSTGPRSRPSLFLLVVVAFALAIGAAASLIAGLATAPAFHSGPETEFAVSLGDFEAGFVIAFAIVIGLLVYARLSSATTTVPGQFVVTVLAMLFVAILFVVILHAAGGGTGGFATGPGGNSTGGGTQNGTTNPNGTLPGSGGVLGSLHLPPWALFAAVAVTVLAVGAIAIPRAWAYATERGRDRATGRPGPAQVEQVRGALATAARELEEGIEPREVIIALYATVLRRVGPMVGGVEVDTPEEIRALHLVRLGIRARASETLTRLFEEARYSSHPMGPDSASRATVAIHEAQEDLDRTPLPP